MQGEVESLLEVRAFGYQAPLLWNQLFRLLVQEADTISKFKVKLKMLLFDKAYIVRAGS
ncbi:unnamed protein product, partial [Pleuronectes platessa]